MSATLSGWPHNHPLGFQEPAKWTNGWALHFCLSPDGLCAMKDLYHVVYLLVKEHCVFFLSRCMYHAALRSFISLTFTFLVGYSFWVVEAQSFCASPRKLFRPAQHVVLQRRSNAALSAGTRIKWIQHSCPSRLYCSDWGGGVEKRYLFSIKLTPGPVMATLCHSIIWSGGPFPSLTLPVLFITSFKSRMYCNFANASISWAGHLPH